MDEKQKTLIVQLLESIGKLTDSIRYDPTIRLRDEQLSLIDTVWDNIDKIDESCGLNYGFYQNLLLSNEKHAINYSLADDKKE